MKILVTGAAGFIGAHTCKALLAHGYNVMGLDNFNSYYDVKLKEQRVLALAPKMEIFKGNLCDSRFTQEVFKSFQPEVVIHLASQPGVRHSVEKPGEYVDNNIKAHFNILEACRQQPSFQKLIYASSSSVYGDAQEGLASESDGIDPAGSVYAVTKRTCELLSESYSRLYNLPQVGLRFFSVYGPWGRPDMSYWLFTKAILAESPLQVFNHGEMFRSFTYVDEAVQSILATLKPAKKSKGRHETYNVGGQRPRQLIDLISALEEKLAIKAIIHPVDKKRGEVVKLGGNGDKLQSDFGMHFTVELEEGISHFVDWYKSFHL